MTKEIKFISSEHKDIYSRLKFLSDYFGINFEAFSPYKYILKNNDIYFISNDWDESAAGMFQRIGLKLGTIDKNNEIVLNTQAAQLLGNYVYNNVFEIESQQHLKIYLEGGIIKTGKYNSGQCVIKYDGYILGTAVVTQAGIKSRFPRSKRTQEIYTDF